MTAALAIPSGSRRSNRSFKIGVAAGVALPLLLLVFALLPRDNPAPSNAAAGSLEPQRAAFAGFEDALEPLVQDGAATVVYGMRPGISDIHGQRFDDETLVGMAEGWVDATRTTRDQFATLDVPPFLAETAELYAQAFDAYHRTAQALLAAAGTTGDQRAEHITRAAEEGTRADQMYDQAKAELDAHRERLGLGATGSPG